ncbi:hypothetical protein ACFPN2_06500 [Steroidobacter flavus]|uniref:Uncharacterized protein n=1 Tax=Steroidobacter flavus TaxID=1842136 RepID=A0ABV8SMX5_9GAMM
MYDLNENPGEHPVFPVVAVAIEHRAQQNVLIGMGIRYVVEMIEQHLKK